MNESIAFESNGATLLPESEAILDQVRLLLEKNPQIQAVAIEGHTDRTGAVAHNQKLSEQRAQSVVQWLVADGIATERLSARGCGISRPLGEDATEEARRKNRRVELHIIDTAGVKSAGAGCVVVPTSRR